MSGLASSCRGNRMSRDDQQILEWTEKFHEFASAWNQYSGSVTKDEIFPKDFRELEAYVRHKRLKRLKESKDWVAFQRSVSIRVNNFNDINDLGESYTKRKVILFKKLDLEDGKPIFIALTLGGDVTRANDYETAGNK